MMASVFAGKRIIVGVTGSIAAFKVAGWVSNLAKEEAMVSVIMTAAGQKFVTPYTFGALSGNPVYTRMFNPEEPHSMNHIDLGKDADLVLVAPATANSIAKLAGGFGGDLLATTILATRAKVVLCPAMNNRMYGHPGTVNNIKRLKELGYCVVDPASGMMACKEEGQGRLPEWDVVMPQLAKLLSCQDLAGQKILITAGPTREAIDPARFLSNRSSGKMGYRLAEEAFRRGAKVILVSGPTSLAPPAGIELVSVQSARQMYEAVMARAEESSIVIKSAAVADYRPETFFENKVKKEAIDTSLKLVKNEDILYSLGKIKKKGQILVGFAAESINLIAEGRKKLAQKNLDIIAVNDISSSNAGFEVDSNQVILVDHDGEKTLPLTSKSHTANLILDRVVDLLPSR